MFFLRQVATMLKRVIIVVAKRIYFANFDGNAANNYYGIEVAGLDLVYVDWRSARKGRRRGEMQVGAVSDDMT